MRVDKPCEHIVKVLKDAEAIGVTFIPFTQLTEVLIQCVQCHIHLMAYEHITPERID